VQSFQRHVHANRLYGIDNEWLTPEQAKAFVPVLDTLPPPATRSTARPSSAAAAPPATTRSPGAMPAPRRIAASTCHPELRGQGRSAAARRRGDEAWRLRRGTDRREEDRRVGLRQQLGHPVDGRREACRWIPYPLQALVSEPMKPMFPCVVMSNSVHAYISQSDKGELVIGAGTDAYTSYSQTGGLQITTHTLDAICELFPMFGRVQDAAQLGRHRRQHAGPLGDHRA
jgi:sarcosine oxidase subunit beta